VQPLAQLAAPLLLARSLLVAVVVRRVVAQAAQLRPRRQAVAVALVLLAAFVLTQVITDLCLMAPMAVALGTEVDFRR